MAKRNIHWLAPVSMLGALFAGVLFVCGHHLFYQSLHGKPVSTGSFFGSPISKQEANTAIGTLFAFLVKACLVFAMSVAFAQLFWREMKAPRSLPTLARLDSVHAAFNNVLNLLDPRTWWNHPLLLLIAATAWLVPIASIITPATLSIQTAAKWPSPVSSLRVPNLDFRSMSFLATMPYVEDFSDPSNLGSYNYNGPSQAVLEMANTVMAQGSMSLIPSPAPNASWHLDFAGPYLKCTDVASDQHLEFRRNIAAGMNDSVDANLYGYLAWSPMNGYWNNDSTVGPPFLANTESGRLRFTPGDFPGASFDNITIYVAAMPQIFEADQHTVTHTFNEWYTGDQSLPNWLDGTMLQCVLINSTYHVSFRYIEGDQHIAIENHADVAQDVLPHAQLLGPNPDSPRLNACEGQGNLTSEQRKICYNNPQVLRSLSYQAILDAFATNLKGSVYVDGYQDFNRKSNVMQTALLDTQQLAFLKAQGATNSFGNKNLQSELMLSNNTDSRALINNDASVSKRALATAIEEMFQNLTVSLMSSPALQPNYSSITAPAPANVTLPVYRNVYVYSALKLGVAYSVAVFLAALAVLLGFITILFNGASYSNNFSSVFRAARGAELSEVLRADDLNGQDPLPKHLARAQVSFGEGKAKSGEYVRTGRG